MSYTSFDFPHTHFYDSDLRELLGMCKKLMDDYDKLVSDINSLNEWRIAHTKDYEELLDKMVELENDIKQFEEDINTEFEQLKKEQQAEFDNLIKEVNTWADNFFNEYNLLFDDCSFIVLVNNRFINFICINVFNKFLVNFNTVYR